MKILEMVFDVESIGLHGEAFAVAYCLFESNGEIVVEGVYACNPRKARGTVESHEWVAKNVPPLEYNCWTPAMVRSAFWSTYESWGGKDGIRLWAECCWPVETSFLSACIEDNHADREWKGPYPLYDISTLMLACGMNPLQPIERLENELPAHHPLTDVRQSARVLRQLLTR